MAALIVKHVQKRPNGTWRYRRRVPSELKELVGKGEIVVPLGDTEQAAIRAYSRVHDLAEKTLAEAKAGLRGDKPEKRQGSRLEVYLGMLDQMHRLGFDPQAKGFDLSNERDRLEWEARSWEADRLERELEYAYDRDPVTGEVLNAPTEDVAMIRWMNGAAPRRPVPTLSDAERLYRTERVKDNEAAGMELTRTMNRVRDALGADRPLNQIDRVDARRVRDFFLQEMQPASVNRYLNTVRAVFNLAIEEHGLSGLRNPFEKIKADLPKNRRNDRRPFTERELRAMRERLRSHAAPDLQRIWLMLEGTGCRLSEIARLLREDVFLDHEVPHIRVDFRENRRIKTDGSIRLVPLVGEALQAARDAFMDSEGHPGLFPRYADKKNGNGVSGAMGKHVEAIRDDSKAVTHSLRHNLKDRLVASGASQQAQDAILGHSSGKVSEGYGSDMSRLRIGAEALRKAFAD